MTTITPPWMQGQTDVQERHVDASDTLPAAQREHLFKPGQSGNPRGRPKGSKNPRTLLLEQLNDAGTEITQLVIDKAKEGDLSAAAIIMARLVPPLKAQAAPVAFTFDRTATLLEQGGAILAAVANGAMDPESGRALIGCLSTLAGLKIDELDERMAALEDKLKGRVL